MIEKKESSETSKTAIQTILETLENNGTTFKLLTLEEIKKLLLETELKNIENTTKLSISTKNYIYFITKEGFLCSLWINQANGYKFETHVENVHKENPTEEEIQTLKELNDMVTLNLKGFTVTEDLKDFLKQFFIKKEAQDNLEQQQIPKKPKNVLELLRQKGKEIKELLGKIF
jgi:predicted nucleotidyltransferase